MPATRCRWPRAGNRPLADQGFVGWSNFQQSLQSYDAAYVQQGKPKALFSNLTTPGPIAPKGIDGTSARPQTTGDTVFALLSYGTRGA